MKFISISLGHNATVAYYENGKFLYLLHEEKFNNIKNSANFPHLCLKYLKEKVDLKDIDGIYFTSLTIPPSILSYTVDKEKKDRTTIYKISGYDWFMYFLTKYGEPLMNFMNDKKIEYYQKKYRPKLESLLCESLGESIASEKIHFIEHHLGHALSPVIFYGLHKKPEPYLIFTLDGSGDKYCATVRIWKDGKLETLATTRYWHSLGYLWSISTDGFGMRPLEHEYKVMGLAAYTSEKYFMPVYNTIYKNMIKIDGLKWRGAMPMNRAYVYLHDKLYGFRFDNIAGALQHLTETRVTEWVQAAIDQTGIKNVAVSGGVFMNVKLNQKIQEMKDVEKVLFMPSCGDESLVTGAIMQGLIDNNKSDEAEAMNSMYLSLPIEDGDVHEFIETNKLRDKYIVQDLGTADESSKKVAELLANFEIVGVARGQGEWGARSLCNRAILSNASDLRSFHTVNDMIKMRDFWMPFAPTMLEDWADRYLKSWNTLGKKVLESAYYMITTFESTLLGQDHLRAAMHQKDKTLRPQLVNEHSNPWMYTTLRDFEKLTGMGGVMNTSLNIHGYPLVGGIDQAMFTLENSGLKHLLLNNILISKK